MTTPASPSTRPHSTVAVEPLTTFVEYPSDKMLRRACTFRDTMARHRTVRDFDPRPVPPGGEKTAAGRAVRLVATTIALVVLASCLSRPPSETRPAVPAIDVAHIGVAASPSPLDAQWHRGAFMQIVVRAYQDSDGDGIGDLKGLTQRLDYLKDLGVTGLWLSSVTPGVELDHGHATTDFRAVDPALGRLADFDELIREAHLRGLGVILGHTMNHSAAEHPLFVASRGMPAQAFRDWYVWAEAAPTGWRVQDANPWHHAATRPWEREPRGQEPPASATGAQGHYFGAFGAHVPEFNFRQPRVVDYHVSNLRFWLNRGVDGFHLDAMSQLIENDAQRWSDQPESRQLAALFSQEVKAYPNRYVLCDGGAQPRAYADLAVCGGAVATDRGRHAVQAALGDAAAVSALITSLRDASTAMAVFSSAPSHGAASRLWDLVNGDVTAYKLAAGMQLLQPGTPVIQYGEEIGQAGLPADARAGNTPSQRGPMSWQARNVGPGGFTTGVPFRAVAPNVGAFNAETQRVDRDSIHAFYKDLLTLRASRASLSQGGVETPFASRTVFGFQRVHGDERTLVLFNVGRTRVEFDVADLPRRARMAPIFPRRVGTSTVAEVTLADGRGRARVTLAPRSVRMLDVEQRAP